MRILSITAGAAGMYCGSCFRDNALAAELVKRGHDVSLVPVYTPTRTDEPNVSQERVLFGGISVYLQQHAPLFRSTPAFLDRLWDAPAVISAFANRAASTDASQLGDLTISMLRGHEGVLRKEFDKLVAWIREEQPPDVINLPNSLLIAMAEPLRQAVGRPVCCTLQGEELFLNGLPSSYREQAIGLIRQHAAHVDRFIAVSHFEAAFMSGLLNVPRARISVVPLGIRMDGYNRAGGAGTPGRAGGEDRMPAVPALPALPGPPAPFCIGYFARIAPEKGLLVLADAYVRLRRRIDRDGGERAKASVRLAAAGYMASNHASYLKDVRRALEAAGRGSEFTYAGEVDRPGKLSFLSGLDVLSVPATYDEPKGLFLLEAMAAGVPVVQPRRGAFTEVVETTGGGILVEPDNVDSLADGLYALWKDRARAQELGTRAFDGVRAHYNIGQSADRLLEAYSAVLPTNSPAPAPSAHASVA